jgi:ABC-type antimicrobial peptide transport system permease subunit
MEGSINQVYSLVLVLGLTGVLLGVVLTILGKMAASTGLTAKAQLGMNKTIDAIYDIPNTWLPVIVIVSVAGIILFLVMRGLGGTSASR